MPRFAFGKRKSTASSDNDLAPPSFRVLDRSEVVAEANGKSFHGGANLSAKRQTLPRATVSDISLVEDNIFAEYKPNYRYVLFLRLPFQSNAVSLSGIWEKHGSNRDQFHTGAANLSLRCLKPGFRMELEWVRGGDTMADSCSLVAVDHPTPPKPTPPTTLLTTVMHRPLHHQQI